MKKNESVQGKDSHSITNEDTKVVENFGTAPIDSIAAFSPGMQESDGNMQSSFQTEGTVPFKPHCYTICPELQLSSWFSELNLC